MTQLFAGGIRNPCSTSYISSILQFLLRFKPLINLFADNDCNKNYLVKVLYNLYKKINDTPNTISADSIISYFKIDPHHASNAHTFLLLLYSNLPPAFHQIIYVSEVMKIVTEIDFNQLISNSQCDFLLNIQEMLIFMVETNNNDQQLIFVNNDTQITIGDEVYKLYGFIQNRGSKYHLIMRDSEGWINCNDSSLSSISKEQVTQCFSDPRMPLELIILVKDLDQIEFSRRKPIFQSDRHEVNFNSAVSTQEDSQIYSDALIKLSNDNFNDQDYDNINHIYSDRQNYKENNLTPQINYYFGPMVKSKTIYRNISSNILNINNKNHENIVFQDHTSKKFNKSRDDDTQNINEEEDIIQLLSLKAPNNHEKNIQNKYSSNLKSLERNRSLNINYIEQRKSDQIKYDIKVRILEFHNNKTFNNFKGNQKLSDIKTLINLYLNNSPDQPMYMFIIINKGEYKVTDDNIQIKDLWEISNHQIELLASLDLNSSKSHGVFNIPLYQTFGHFRFIKNIRIRIDISDTCQQLIDSAQKNCKNSIELIAFDDKKKEFITFHHNEKLYKIFCNYKNLRIQNPIPKNSVVFIYEKPFAYSLKDNQTLKTLTKEIQQYLDLNNGITIEYNRRVYKDYNNPKAAWINHLFEFMVIKSTRK